jgi:hypothetical protein
MYRLVLTTVAVLTVWGASGSQALARPDPGGNFHGGGGRDFDGAPNGRQSPEAREWHERHEREARESGGGGNCAVYTVGAVVVCAAGMELCVSPVSCAGGAFACYEALDKRHEACAIGGE